jgi:hypothetical protein
MKKTNILLCLEKLCHDLSIVVKYDKFFGRGGFCRLRDQSYFIINERLSNDAKEQLFVDGFKGYDFATSDIPSQLKDLLGIEDNKR